MELVWHYLKSNAGSSIGVLLGALLGGVGGVITGGGLTLGGIALGGALALAGGAGGYFAGGAIDKSRNEIKPLNEGDTLASRKVKEEAQSASYEVKMTEDMWNTVDRMTSGGGLKTGEQAALAATRGLVKDMKFRLDGTKLGDQFTVTSAKLEPLDNIDLKGQPLTFRIKGDAIDFSHPESMAGLDKLAAALYEQREALFERTLDQLPLVRSVVPERSLDAARGQLRKGDINNPAEARIIDDITSVLGANFLQTMARDYGTQGLETLLKSRLSRYVGGTTGLTQEAADAAAKAVAEEYKKPDVRGMAPRQAAHHLAGLEAVQALERFQVPRYSYDMKEYLVDLAAVMHASVSEGLKERVATGKTAALDKKDMPGAETALATLARDFKEGRFDGLAVNAQPVVAKAGDRQPGIAIT